MSVEILVEDVENIMNDIFLSGFFSVSNITIEKIEKNSDIAEKLGMKKLSQILVNLKIELNKRKNSFENNLISLTDVFCKLEFYMENLKRYSE